jgi:molecular chaperone GrpE (heat shock protein)
VLLCDEKSVKPKEKEESGDDPTDLNVKVFDQLEESIRQTVLSGYRKNALRVEGSFKTQTENLEKQFTEVKQMTEAVKEAAFEYSKPLSTNIEELMQQITAIRDYASGQQGRIEKLQDGYDWNIIRTFCLRVIRCIDNLDNRIRLKFEEGIQTGELEEIRDELLFALESSGVEQFEPEVNSDFTGKEKLAEVIKEKEYSKDPDMKGKIARIIKHGYRYVIDDGNTKVVRAARVKLFG